MSEAFRLGGWGMYPTLIIGLLLAFAAVRFAVRPERHRLTLIIWMQVLTMLVGILGFTAGLIRASLLVGRGTQPADSLIQGFGESLHNVGLALCLVVMAGIAGAIGLARRKRGAAAGGSGSGSDSLVDPFA